MDLVQRHDLGPSVTAVLRQLILRGDLLPGQRLVESELAERFGTSRGPVRDALAELERSGLVVSRPRRGSLVRELTADDVDEVYSLRLALESLAIRRLVVIPDRNPADGLWDLLDGLTEAHTSRDRMAIGAADMALHRAIVVNSGHQRLRESWEKLADQTVLLMTVLSSLDAIIQGPSGDHHKIVERLARCDGEAAVDALESHLTSARATILEQFETE